MSETSSLYSLSDSIRQDLFRFQGKRRLQAVNEDYHWPYDSAAVRWELTIAAMAEITYVNGLYHEPEVGALERVLTGSTSGDSRNGTILDLGCGLACSWAISMAERFPSCEVIGVDLVPTDLVYLPANLSIEVHDILEGLPYADGSIDLVHARAVTLAASFSSSVLPEIARVLRPGGVLMLEEYEDTHNPFLSHRSPNPHLDAVLARHRLRTDILDATTPEHVSRLTWGARMADEVGQTVGFRDEDRGQVDEMRVEMPIGRKNGDPTTSLGCLNRELFLTMWEIFSVASGTPDESIQALRKEDEQALPEQDVGLFNMTRVVWAGKGDLLESPKRG